MGAEMNPHVVQALFDEIQQAELAHRVKGIPHHVYLKARRHRYQGMARRELERIISLGPKAGEWVDLFLEEFKEWM